MRRLSLLAAALVATACAPAEPDPAAVALHPGPCMVESTGDWSPDQPGDADGYYAYALDEAGELVRAIHRSDDVLMNGSTTWTRDDRGRPVRIRWVGWEASTTTQFTYDGDVLVRRERIDGGLHTGSVLETWDARGRPLSEERSAYGDRTSTITWTYAGDRRATWERTEYALGDPDLIVAAQRRVFEHDDADRIIGWVERGADGEVQGLGERSYPEPGVMFTRIMRPDGTLVSEETAVRDAMDRLISRERRDADGRVLISKTWTYDDAGRLVERTDGDDVWRDTYDADGRLVKHVFNARTWHNTYDAAGNLILVVGEADGEEIQRRTFDYSCFTDPEVDPATWLDNFGSW